MTGHKKLKRSEVLLLLLSVVMMIGIGMVALRDRNAMIRESGELRFVVEDVRLRYTNLGIPNLSTPPLGQKAGETIIQATVSVRCEGQTPDRWHQTPVEARHIRLVDKNGKEYKVRTSFGTARVVDEPARRHYIFDHLCVIPKSLISTGIGAYKATVLVRRDNEKIASIPISAPLNTQ